MKKLLLIIGILSLFLSGCKKNIKNQRVERPNTQEPKQVNWQNLKQQQEQLDLLERSYEIDLPTTEEL